MRADARRAALAAALLASLLALPALPASADRARPVEAGERAPDIALPDQHGRPFRLTDALAERDYLVVAFYVKAFTGGWELEFSRFRDDQPKFTALGAEIVGISADSPETNREWARALKLPFRLLSDTTGRVSRSWGAWDDLWRLPRRATFIVDRTGRVRWVEAGGVAIETSHALAALERLARPK